MLEEIENLGMMENTIIVLWGDHGFHLRKLGIWTKHVNYELANNIPLLIVAPGNTSAGSSTSQPAESVDIFPTLTELAGLPAPNGTQPMDGISLVPVLQNPEIRLREYAYHAYPRGNRIGRAIRIETHRLVEWKEIGADRETADIELYDYALGKVERRNIAEEYPEIVHEMRAILDKHPEAHVMRTESQR